MQVYFSPKTERHLYEKAQSKANFSKHVKDLMQKENFIEDIRHMLQVPATTNNKPGEKVLSQFI